MTTQTMDTVYLDGYEYWTSEEPLRSLPGLPKFLAFSTANHRGYDAIWSIVADKLFLVALAGKTHNNPSERGLAMVFPGCTAPVFADWFCGTMVLNNGRIVKNDVVPIFENEVTLKFSSGRVVSQERLKRKYSLEALLDPVLFTPISECYVLTDPVIDLLVAAGVHRLGDLVQMSPTALMRIPGFDVLTMESIEFGLLIFGFTVGMVLPGWSAVVSRNPEQPTRNSKN